MSSPSQSDLLQAAAILNMPVEDLRKRLGAPTMSNQEASVNTSQVIDPPRAAMHSTPTLSVEDQGGQVERPPLDQDQTQFHSSHTGHIDYSGPTWPEDFIADSLFLDLKFDTHAVIQDEDNLWNMMNSTPAEHHINLDQLAVVHPSREVFQTDSPDGTYISPQDWPLARVFGASHDGIHSGPKSKASAESTPFSVILTPSSSAKSTLSHSQSGTSSLVPTPSSSATDFLPGGTRSPTSQELSASPEAAELLNRMAAGFGPCSRLWTIPPVSL